MKIYFEGQNPIQRHMIKVGQIWYQQDLVHYPLLKYDLCETCQTYLQVRDTYMLIAHLNLG